MNAHSLISKLVCEGREYLLDQEIVTIGRDDDNTVILEDESVSSHHAVIHFTGENIQLRDLDSTNGTYHNGIMVQKAMLSSGDSLGFGAVDCELLS